MQPVFRLALLLNNGETSPLIGNKDGFGLHGPVLISIMMRKGGDRIHEKVVIK